MRIKKAKREDRRSGETRGKDPDFKKEKKNLSTQANTKLW